MQPPNFCLVVLTSFDSTGKKNKKKHPGHIFFLVTSIIMTFPYFPALFFAGFFINKSSRQQVPWLTNFHLPPFLLHPGIVLNLWQRQSPNICWFNSCLLIHLSNMCFIISFLWLPACRNITCAHISEIPWSIWISSITSLTFEVFTFRNWQVKN